MTTVAGTRQGADGDLVARTLAAHGRSLLATAQRHSLCPDDAADAYQRALEIFLRHAARLEPGQAYKWLHTVVKHEAITLRAERQRVLPRHAYDFVGAEARHEPSPDDRVLEADHAARVAEALTRLKPAEAQALWLQATGRSYEQIAGDLGWTRTKVNRSIAEGRARLRAGVAGIEAGEECARWQPVLAAIADGSAGAGELAAARRHLRNCPGCRAGIRTLHEAGGRPLTAVVPVGLILAGLHERALGAVVRAQGMLEALVSGKAAAVAASAAAVAGGSLTVVDRALEPDRAHRSPVRVATTAPPAPVATPRAARRIPGPATARRRAAPAHMTGRAPGEARGARPVSRSPAGEDLGPGWVADTVTDTETGAGTAPVTPAPSPPAAHASSDQGLLP